MTRPEGITAPIRSSEGTHKRLDRLKAAWSKSPLKQAYDLTKSKPTTSGNLDKSSYPLAIAQGATDGFYFFGANPAGILSGGSAGAVSTYVLRKTGSVKLGLAAGAATGALLLASLTAITGGMMLPAALTAGALLGLLEAYRSHKVARVRDGTVNAMMISGLLVPGFGKIVGGIASGFAVSGKNPKESALRGAFMGFALGGLLGALGIVPGGAVVAAIASGLAGGLGPFIAPKYSQFFRNLSEKLGKPILAGLEKLGIKKKFTPKTTLAIGTVPSGFLHEVLRAFMISDFNPVRAAIGGCSMILQQLFIIKEQQSGFKEEKEAKKA